MSLCAACHFAEARACDCLIALLRERPNHGRFRISVSVSQLIQVLAAVFVYAGMVDAAASCDSSTRSMAGFPTPIGGNGGSVHGIDSLDGSMFGRGSTSPGIALFFMSLSLSAKAIKVKQESKAWRLCVMHDECMHKRVYALYRPLCRYKVILE